MTIETQPSSACIDGGADVSSDHALRDRRNENRRNASFTADSIFHFREAGKNIGESFIYIARPLLPSIAGSGVMMVAIWGWQEVSTTLSPILRLAVSVVMGGLVYVAYLWLTQREMFYEVRELVGRK